MSVSSILSTIDEVVYSHNFTVNICFYEFHFKNKMLYNVLDILESKSSCLYISNECAIFFTRLFHDMREHSNTDGLYSLWLILHVSVNFFCFYFPVKWNYCMLTVFSLKRNILEVLVSPPTPPLSSNSDPFGGGAARPTPTLFSSIVFFPLQEQRKPSLLSTSQLFLICCSHPRHDCFSYQPDRTRIHILQAFMMAAAHLCKPVCLACLQTGSPPEH